MYYHKRSLCVCVDVVVVMCVDVALWDVVLNLFRLNAVQDALHSIAQQCLHIVSAGLTTSSSLGWVRHPTQESILLQPVAESSLISSEKSDHSLSDRANQVSAFVLEALSFVLDNILPPRYDSSLAQVVMEAFHTDMEVLLKDAVVPFLLPKTRKHISEMDPVVQVLRELQARLVAMRKHVVLIRFELCFFFCRCIGKACVRIGTGSIGCGIQFC